jgi:hypothetical protein
VAVGGAALSEGTGWALRVRHAAFAAGHDAPLIGECVARTGASQRKVIRHRLRFSAPPFRSAEWQVGTWCQLLSALRAAGIHAPSDVDRDIVEDGRVSGRRMIIVWDEDGGFYGIVERLAQETLAADSRFLLINNEVAVEDVVQSVMAHFSGPGQGSPEAAA